MFVPGGSGVGVSVGGARQFVGGQPGHDGSTVIGRAEEAQARSTQPIENVRLANNPQGEVSLLTDGESSVPAKSGQSLTLWLTDDETRALAADAHAAYRTQLTDLLLAALAQTLPLRGARARNLCQSLCS